MSMADYDSNKVKYLAAMLDLGQPFRYSQSIFETTESSQLIVAFQKLCVGSDKIELTSLEYCQVAFSQQVGLAGAICVAACYEQRFQAHCRELAQFQSELNEDLACPAYHEEGSLYPDEQRLRSMGALDSLSNQCEYLQTMLNRLECEVSGQKEQLMKLACSDNDELREDLFITGSAFRKAQAACAALISHLSLSELLSYCPLCLKFSDAIVSENIYQYLYRTLVADIYTKYRLNDYVKRAPVVIALFLHRGFTRTANFAIINSSLIRRNHASDSYAA